jgi:uncharacterized protein (TIGR02145 family)
MKRFTFISIVLTAMIALQLHAQVSFDINVYLEGPYNGTEMNTALNSAGLIPLTQPYSVAPWNYPGTEQVSLIPNADIVDWVLIELRETTGNASTATPDKMIHRQAAFLKKGSEVVGLDGSSLITYSGSITSNLYLILWHRNHLAIMSSGALTNTGGIYSWDFTDQLSKAYLGGQQQISTGIFGMYAGDADGSGMIYDSDIDPNWSTAAGKWGYINSDLNLNSQVNNQDKDDIWLPNYGIYSRLPSCGLPVTDGRDGKTYATIQIGNQCWMAQNINIGSRINTPTYMQNNQVIEKYCYDNLESNCDTYGGLYQWEEAMQYTYIPGVTGICMDGWHLPTDDEWKVLEGTADSFYPVGDPVWNLTSWRGLDAGKRLKKSSGWQGTGNGTDVFGFGVLPSGYWEPSGPFAGINSHAFIWTSDELNTWLNKYYRFFFHGEDRISRDYGLGKNYGFAVRCIRNNQSPLTPYNPQPPHRTSP